MVTNRSFVDITNYSFFQSENGTYYITVIANQKVDYARFQVRV